MPSLLPEAMVDDSCQTTSFVAAATGHLLEMWTEANTPDSPVQCSIVSTDHTTDSKHEQETAVTYPECPLSEHLQEPAQPALSASHTRTVPSFPPEAMTVPSAEKATERISSLHNRSNNQYSLYLVY